MEEGGRLDADWGEHDLWGAGGGFFEDDDDEDEDELTMRSDNEEGNHLGPCGDF